MHCLKVFKGVQARPLPHNGLSRLSSKHYISMGVITWKATSSAKCFNMLSADHHLNGPLPGTHVVMLVLSP